MGLCRVFIVWVLVLICNCQITFNHFVSPFRFCRCGLPRDRHKLQGTVIITDPSVTWVSEQCTRRIPTDTFGEIEFAEDPSSRKPVSSKFFFTYHSITYQALKFGGA